MKRKITKKSKENHITQKAQELFEKFLKEYCDTGYMYSGMMFYEPGHIREYRELEELWKKKAGCFMVNGKFEEIEKVMKR